MFPFKELLKMWVSPSFRQNHFHMIDQLVHIHGGEKIIRAEASVRVAREPLVRTGQGEFNE